MEFLGPLTVAAVRSHNAKALLWPALAPVGVIGLTAPWHGTVDLGGLGFAALAAVGWACYIVVTQRVGDCFTGISALSMTVPIAAVTAAFVGGRPPVTSARTSSSPWPWRCCCRCCRTRWRCSRCVE